MTRHLRGFARAWSDAGTATERQKWAVMVGLFALLLAACVDWPSLLFG
jgi:hypothetical protein